MNKMQFFQEIYNRFGAVSRARNCFLYTKKSFRLTDMYQENGRAILGWHGDSAFTVLKNTLSRGLTGSFITEDKSRVEKSVSDLFNSERKVLFFFTKTDAVKASLIFDEANTCFWRPWLQVDVDFSNITSIVYAPALAWTETVYLLCVKKEIFESKKEILNSIKTNVKLPFALEVAIARSNYNLIQALKEREEKQWFIYDSVLCKYFTRKGPYLYSKVPENQYDAFVLHCLDLGILINPDYNEVSIVPFGADKGVFSKLKNKPFEFEL